MKSIIVSGTKIDSNTQLIFTAKPKRDGKKAHARYQTYECVTNLYEYYFVTDTKYAKADLRYDIEHGHLTLVYDDGTAFNNVRFVQDMYQYDAAFEVESFTKLLTHQPA